MSALVVPLVAALLLAAAPAAQRPDAVDAALALDCAAYLSLGLGEAEARGRVDQPLQRQFEAWMRAFKAGSGPEAVERSGKAMADRAAVVGREGRKTRAAHTAWCRRHAPAP